VGIERFHTKKSLCPQTFFLSNIVRGRNHVGVHYFKKIWWGTRFYMKSCRG